jgi:UDP-N-acetylmuramyl pentapeptide phosphotransferase/UDP-N-acetylglucosamine-1-phosphate transferase
MMLLAVFALSVLLASGVLVLRLRHADRGLDLPGERSLHAVPTPHGGGLAIVLVALVVGVWAGVSAMWLLAVVILATVSAIDDWRPQPAWLRLSVHLLMAASVVFMASESGSWSGLLWVIAIAWTTNAYNFMDGADGLSGSMALIGFSAYAFGFALAGQHALAMLCAGVAGAALGFLRCNWYPARIFMGDVGSIPLGFLAGGLGWYAAVAGAWSAWFGPLVFAPFLLDATLTLLRRAWRGERVWQAHREHVYQRMVRAGMRHDAMCRRWLLVMLAGAALALLLLGFAPTLGWAGLLLWSAVLVWFGVAAGRQQQTG